jgi:hypothetical protein
VNRPSSIIAFAPPKPSSPGWKIRYPLVQPLGDETRGAVLLETQLRMRVRIAPDRGEFVAPFGDEAHRRAQRGTKIRVHR